MGVTLPFKCQYMPDMMPASLVAIVAPPTGKFIKIVSVFLKVEKFAT